MRINPSEFSGEPHHVDVTKFGNIPDGGGHRFVGRQQGDRNKRATPGPKGSNYLPRNGKAFLHTVVDDHSRVPYAEIHADERGDTATAVLRRAVTWFREHGVTVERVLSDNGSAYRSFAWRDTCAELGITPKRTRPYRPQTNGKVERFHRTLAEGWAYARHYQSETERRTALHSWIHFYNHHRAHSALGGQPPITRLTNLPGHHRQPGLVVVQDEDGRGARGGSAWAGARVGHSQHAMLQHGHSAEMQ